ncbi:hypothetical protein KBZ15_14235 [Cyanobium sp. BA20m-p-22]|uniref:hypothetical protein n=1 Tax=Cyanobium sp. BA20m-p-22 TaxID=2823704 RepID=UPI0020CEE58B|nr:hypothetical protein [Cyanobium sp. BA20m-p-22]MCP9911047.1 hypothetical protein [Cyanobium sp. BA20m-p-22]
MTPISPANHELSGGRGKGPSPQSTIDIPKLVLLLAGDSRPAYARGRPGPDRDDAHGGLPANLTAGLNTHVLKLVVLHLEGNLALLFNGPGRFSFDADMGTELISGLDQGGAAPKTDQPDGFGALTTVAVSVKAFHQAD